MSTLEGNKVRIIGYDKSVEMCHSNNKFENRRTIKNEPSIKNTSVEKEENPVDNHPKKFTLLFKILIGIIIAVVIGLVVTLCAVYIPRNNKNENQEKEKIISVIPEENRKLGSEFDFNTKEGDLKIISVKQKMREDRAIDWEKVTTYSTKITNYWIYILSEKESDEENKNYYDKIYECAISIQSECFTSTNEDCTPIERLDLSKPTRRTRNIEEESDNISKDDKLKEIPIPFCLFNLTNNDAITSIACPQSFPEVKKKKMVLDLYFFRPPGVKRSKEENLNSTITRKTEGNKKYIREINGCICDIENAQFSYCSTDMNTTTDLDNNILSYDELATMNITTDSDNYYLQYKTTNLVDKTENIENDAIEEYKKNLNKFIEKIEPYLKYQVLFSKENFEEYYYIVKKNTSFVQQKRKLRNEVDDYKEEISNENNVWDVFTPTSGIRIDVTLLNNAGLLNNFMQADNYFYLDNKKLEVISKSEESSKSLKQILKDLVLLTDAGNHKVNELYKNTNITLENLTEEIRKYL